MVVSNPEVRVYLKFIPMVNIETKLRAFTTGFIHSYSGGMPIARHAPRETTDRRFQS